MRFGDEDMLVCSADGSWTDVLGRPPRRLMHPRKYARLPGRGVCMDTAGWRCMGALSRRLAPCFPNRLSTRAASDGSGFYLRYCTTVLQPPMQTLGFDSSQSISRHPPMPAAALMSRDRCLRLRRGTHCTQPERAQHRHHGALFD